MRLRLILFTLLLALPHLLVADETWSGAADVKFRGYSTLHNFEGTVKQVPLKVTVAGGEKDRVVSATSNVEVKEMSTAHEGRDKNMLTMFQQAKHRFIKVEVDEAKEQALRPSGGGPGSMPVKLTIAGTTGIISAKVTNVVEAETRGSFELAFPVSLKQFKLDPPKSLGGLVKVRDNVDVTVRVVLKREAAK
jgi:hypothetical protein